ncbi:rRNA cytosine-C5-methyltransferase [Dysgonomonas sp. 25]|uniref:methyltransferase RsmF C-terminal domain-like protein n=1 Tax=Dysgonomonas sp. 25 TaxID=2302933 RepID=UPI0013D6218E|nr:rRNA cytosine-C5-methyltransferase [Dysgonomonas sp. 25]NDV69028.1 rRNA cytosine-C5-methyltransferase [Dysgonomonas sp. 25]
MNLPSDFIGRTKKILGDEWEVFLSALSEESPVSIRLNKRKYHAGDLSCNAVPWSEGGYYLPSRPSFTFDPLFHAGCYYVQEASSMFIGQAFSQYVKGEVKVLDLCAAPGGKSTLIADAIPEGSLLVANEVIRSRANILSENITKWGNEHVVATNNDPAKIGELTHFFDVVLVDAPCSGEGMFRKDEIAIKEWSVANVQLCKERQQRIVADVWAALKPGGLLIYSTCTYNTDENEDNVQWIADEFGAEVLPVQTEVEWGISGAKKGNLPVYRFFPHRTKGEGFFMALLRKPEGETYQRRAKKDKGKAKASAPQSVKGYVETPDSFDFLQRRNDWYAIPKAYTEDIHFLLQELNVISMGIHLGEEKGKDFLPAHGLAISNKLNRTAFPAYEVDWRTAIAYLKREPLLLDDQPKGYILLTYKGIALGFVKNIGNRANNLYPQEWRIRSNNLPASEITVL